MSGNIALAEKIAALGDLIDVKAGRSIIEQGGEDNDVYFILAGVFIIFVNDKKVATRAPNEHVGEMAAIQQTPRRS